MNAEAGPAGAGKWSWRHFFKSLSIGAGGCLVVLFFLATFLRMLSILKFMPWVIAFNSALTGFRLVGNVRRPHRHIRLFSAVAGLLVAMLSGAVYAGAAVYFEGGVNLSPADMLIFATVGIACAFTGAVLAQKYNQST